MRNPTTRRWATLSDRTKRDYMKQGVSSRLYNRYYDKPPAARATLDRQAKASGYKSGLAFMVIETDVRLYAENKIKPTTPASEAARLMMKGTKGETARRQRQRLAKLYNFDEFDPLEWMNVLSP